MQNYFLFALLLVFICSCDGNKKTSSSESLALDAVSQSADKALVCSVTEALRQKIKSGELVHFDPWQKNLGPIGKSYGQTTPGDHAAVGRLEDELFQHAS